MFLYLQVSKLIEYAKQYILNLIKMLTHTPQCLARDYNVPGSCQTSDEECYHQIVAWSPMVRLPPQPK